MYDSGRFHIFPWRNRYDMQCNLCSARLSDPSNVGIPIDVLGSGTIEIVPEPSMFVIFSIGIGLVGIFQVHRKIRRRGW